MFFPPSYEAAQFFDTVIDTINTIDESDINLLDKFGGSSYYHGISDDKDKFKQKFEPVFTLFKVFLENVILNLLEMLQNMGLVKFRFLIFLIYYLNG